MDHQTRLRQLLLAHPFELLFGLLGVLSGLPVLLGAKTANAAQLYLHGWSYIIWGGLISLGGAAVVTGLLTYYFAKDMVRQVVGARIEQAGWVAWTGGMLVYMVAIVSVGRFPQAVFGFSTFTVLVVAFACRHRALTYVVRGLKRVIRNGGK